MPAWDRLIRFVDNNGEERYGQPIDPHVDVGIAMSKGNRVRAKTIVANSALDASATISEDIVEVKRLLSPLRVDEAEFNLPIPPIPTTFLKTNTCLSSPTDPIYPPHPPDEHNCLLDYEVELAVVIGETCKDIPEERAMQYVLGYMTANDVTARRHQNEVSQWDYAKGFDGFAPIGPTLVSTRAVPDPSVLKLRTVLNGNVMQDGKAHDMIFSIPKIVSFLSQGCTLRRGTVIFTGTPSGVGVGQKPAVSLNEGDELLISISHGLGTLTNPILGCNPNGKPKPHHL